MSKRAVVRNTLRRRACEWVRKFALPTLPPADVAVIFSPSSVGVSPKELYKELEHAFNQLQKVLKK